MERAHVLSTLRQDGAPPEAWAAAHPIASRIARRMVAHAPSERPSCGEVLGELLIEKLWRRAAPEGGNPLELVVAELHAQAAKLQRRLREREAEVAALRALLAEKGVSAEEVEAAATAQRQPSIS